MVFACQIPCRNYSDQENRLQSTVGKTAQHSTAYFDAHDRQLNSSRKVLCKYPYSDIQWLICVVFCNTPCLPCMAVWVITIKYKKQKQCCFTVYLETDHDLHTICSSWHLIFFFIDFGGYY